MKKKIGLYGGTFNPVHFGHLTLAIALKEGASLDEVWVIPAQCSPFRQKEESPSFDHRSQMVALAIEEIPDFHLLPIEGERPPPSYTIDTVDEILSAHSDKDFFLLMGEDTVGGLAEWKEIETLLAKIPLIVGCRPGSERRELPPTIQRSVERGWIETPQIEISATELRERLKKGLYCGHLLPSKVLDYISVNQLYFTAKSRTALP